KIGRKKSSSSKKGLTDQSSEEIGSPALGLAAPPNTSQGLAHQTRSRSRAQSQPKTSVSTTREVPKKSLQSQGTSKKKSKKVKEASVAATTVQHELDDNLYDELVADIEINLEDDENFIPASGLSVEASHSSTGLATSQIQSPTSYMCEMCSSVLTTKHGFEKHKMLHMIKEANSKRPSAETLQPLIESFVINSLKEILHEYGEEKKEFVQEILKTAELPENSDWNGFLQSISEPVLFRICKPTKMLPANQYEEQLVCLNQLLNDKQKFSNLLQQLMTLSLSFHTEALGKVVLYRLLSKLVDKMKPIQKDKEDRNVKVTFDAQETVAFEIHMKRLIQKYYVKGLSNGSKVWLARCACIRQRFVEGRDYGSGPTVEEIVSSNAWDEDEDGDFKIKLTSTTLNLFIGLESIIECLILQSTNVNSENVLNVLLNKNENAELLESWYTLTSPFLSETESLVFLKDIVSMICTLSLRLEVGKLRNIDSQQRIKKYALRTDLKRN
ncbi:Argininosuccinate synthase, partial [Frankliniella fusca]